MLKSINSNAWTPSKTAKSGYPQANPRSRVNGFGQVVFDRGALWTFAETAANYATIGAFSGLWQDDVLDVTDVGAETTATLGANNVLTLSGGSASATVHLDPNANYSDDTFALTSDGQTGTDLRVLQTSFTAADFDDLVTAATQANATSQANPSVRLAYIVDLASPSGAFEAPSHRIAPPIDLPTDDSLTLRGAGQVLQGAPTLPALIVDSGTVVNAAGVEVEGGSDGGSGVFLYGGALDNAGLILAGASASESLAAVVVDGGVLTNTGVIEAGAPPTRRPSSSIRANSSRREPSRPIRGIGEPEFQCGGRVREHAGADGGRPRRRLHRRRRSSEQRQLELAGTTAGVLPGFGTQIAGFGDVIFDPGAHWTLSGSWFGFATAVLSGFAPGDALDITDVGTETSGYLDANNVLTLSGGSLTAHIYLDPSQTYVDGTFSFVSDGDGGTYVTVVNQTTFTVGDASALQSAVAAVDVGGADSAPNLNYTFNLDPTSGALALDAPLAPIDLAAGDALTTVGANVSLDDGLGALTVASGHIDLQSVTVIGGAAAGPAVSCTAARSRSRTARPSPAARDGADGGVGVVINGGALATAGAISGAQGADAVRFAPGASAC